MEEILKATLLECFDDDAERNIVRTVFQLFEKKLATVVRDWAAQHDKVVTEAEQLRVERDFYRDQYESASTGELKARVEARQ